MADAASMMMNNVKRSKEPIMVLVCCIVSFVEAVDMVNINSKTLLFTCAELVSSRRRRRDVLFLQYVGRRVNFMFKAFRDKIKNHTWR